MRIEEEIKQLRKSFPNSNLYISLVVTKKGKVKFDSVQKLHPSTEVELLADEEESQELKKLRKKIDNYVG